MNLLVIVVAFVLVVIVVASAVSKCLFVQQLNWIVVRTSDSIYCSLRGLMVF